jgi:hypothetical protein
LNTGTNVQLNAEIIREQQQLVKEGHFNDLFQALADHRNMTAFETSARIEENIVIVAPAITALQKEIFSPMLDRILNLLVQAKRVPEPPVDFESEVVYQGRLALAMSNIQNNAMEATLAKWAPYATLAPVFDNVDFNYSFRQSWLSSGAPAEGLKDVDTMLADQERVQQLQLADAQANIADTASKAFKNVNEAVDPDGLAAQLI